MCPPTWMFECCRKLQVEERLQQQRRLQDAAVGVQAQHEASIHETAALYSKLTASHAASSRHLVRPLPVPSPGRTT